MNSRSYDKWRLQLLGEGVLRIQWAEDGIFNDQPTAIVENRPPSITEIIPQQTKKGVSIKHGAFQISLNPALSPFDGKKALSISWNSGGMNGAWHPGLEASNLGGDIRSLDLCGMARRVYRLKDGLLSRAGWFLLDDSATPLLDPSRNLKSRKPGKRIDWYLFAYGKDFYAGLHDLALVLGKTPMLPKKILGFWWSRWHPYSDKDIRNLIHRFDKEQMPLSVLVLDMDWHKEGWCHWDWDLSLIPILMNIANNFYKLRHRLLPYLYTLTRQCSHLPPDGILESIQGRSELGYPPGLVKGKSGRFPAAPLKKRPNPAIRSEDSPPLFL